MSVEAGEEGLCEDLLQFDGVERTLVLARLLHRVRRRRVVPRHLVNYINMILISNIKIKIIEQDYVAFYHLVNLMLALSQVVRGVTLQHLHLHGVASGSLHF